MSIFNIECSISGALPSQPLDEAQSVGVVRTIRSGDLDALKEVLESYALAVGKPARGESVWLPTSTKKIEAKGDEVSRLVHSTRRDVDIDQDLINCRSHGLKISAPENHSSGNVFCFVVGEKRPRIRRVSHARSHANGNV